MQIGARLRSILLAVTYLEADGILLDLLGALSLVLVGRLDAQFQGQLGPGLDLATFKLAYQLVESEDAKALAIASRRCAEGLAQGGRVCRRRHGWVASEDERDIGLFNGGCCDGTVWQNGAAGGLPLLLSGTNAETVRRKWWMRSSARY